MKRRLFWIVEVFIWLLVLFAISCGILLFKNFLWKQYNTYQIFLPDVDGLIDGSPVKILGIQVGYVSQLDIVGEDVYVKFIITRKGVKIPSGSIATVEFAGLGGSKSLEIYPPKNNINPSKKFIISQPPKRIAASASLLNQMYEEVMEIAYAVSHFMGELGVIKSKEIEIQSTETVNEFLNLSNSWLDDAQKKSDKVTERLNKIKNYINGE